MMEFDNLKPKNPYLEIVKDIIRQGIAKEKGNLKRKDKEDLKNQQLAEVFNIIGCRNEKMLVYAGKEHIQKGSTKKEDIYFYLDDDNRTRVFYAEGKRLPKVRTANGEEYVCGVSTTGNPSGGIERYKLGLHGDSNKLKSNALIAYIERQTISNWKRIVNMSIAANYPNDTKLSSVAGQTNEFTSSHEHLPTGNTIEMHHFWIDITKNK